MSVHVDELARELADLTPDELVDVVTDALGQTQAAPWGPSVGVLLRALLTSSDRVEALAGEPRRLIDSDVVESDIRIRAAARAAVLSVEMLDSSGVGQLLGVGVRNTREEASRLRRRGALLGLPNGRRAYVFPAFQFDVAGRRINPVVARVNEALDAIGDPWGVGSWWVSPHARLGGSAPLSLVGTDREGDLLVLAGVKPAASAV